MQSPTEILQLLQAELGENVVKIFKWGCNLKEQNYLY